MPKAFIGTGSPTGLTMNGACTVDGPSIGLFAFVNVVPLTSGNSYTAFTSRTLTYGPSNIPAISLGAVDAPGTANGWIEMFYLQGVAFGAGATSKVVYDNGVAVKSIGIKTITYTNVSQVTPGSFAANSRTGTSCSLSIASAVGKYVVGGFVCAAAITGASAGTQRLFGNDGTSGNAQNASVVDAVGGAVSTLTATTASSANWAGVACGIDFLVASNADHQATRDVLHGALTGQGSSSDTSHADLGAVTAVQFDNIVATQTALLGLANINTPLLNTVFDFSTYPDGAMPGAFNVIDTPLASISGSGNATAQIVGGKAVLVPGATTNAVNGKLVIYSTGSHGDYQQVSGIWTGVPSSGALNGLAGRVNVAGDTLISWTFANNSWTLSYLVAGVETVITSMSGINVVTFTQFAFKPGAKYTLACGTSNGATKFQILENAIALTDINNHTEFSAPSSHFGPSYRLSAESIGGYTGDSTHPTVMPLPMATFAASDNAALTPIAGVSSGVSIGEVPAGTKNGTNLTFTTSLNFHAGTTAIYRNGLRELLGIGYTESGGNTLNFTTAPLSNDDITVDYVLL